MCIRDSFSRVVGSHVIEDEHAIGYDIEGLEPGNCYFIRVRAGNEHGFGCPTTSSPPGATPSSKFRNRRNICRVGQKNRRKVIYSKKQSGFLAHPYKRKYLLQKRLFYCGNLFLFISLARCRDDASVRRSVCLERW